MAQDVASSAKRTSLQGLHLNLRLVLDAVDVCVIVVQFVPRRSASGQVRIFDFSGTLTVWPHAYVTGAGCCHQHIGRDLVICTRGADVCEIGKVFKDIDG